MLRFSFMFFLIERDRKLKKYECDRLAIQFPTKWCLFQQPRSKTVGEDAFLVAKVQFFRRREKHIVT